MFPSLPSEDGWVREARSGAGTGGAVRSDLSGDGALRIGDDRYGRQLKSILSFDTSSLPPGASIVSAALEIRSGGRAGSTVPFGALGDVYVAIKRGSFGTGKALERSDFQAAPDLTRAAAFNYQGPPRTVYHIPLTPDAIPFVNGSGRTQLRLAFAEPSDRDGAPDWIGYESGEAQSALLRITYSAPATPAPTAPPVIDPTVQSTPAPVSTPQPSGPTPAPGIWRPRPGTSWQWQLTGTIDTSFNVAMYDVDLFDVPQRTIDELHAAGRKVICYFSAGSWENWRPDASRFPAAVQGSSNGWPGERWLDIRNTAALGPVMAARLDLAVQKRCDGVEPDNVDGYTNRTGFPLTGADQLRYNRWLAQEAHARGLSIGLKNDLEQVSALVADFDWALNEQCFQYDECELLLPFIRAGKAVFGVEYSVSASSFCPAANAMNFDWLKKNLDLGAGRTACR